MPLIGPTLGENRECPYCKRQMVTRDARHGLRSLPALYPTRDHVHPRSHGGTAWVWACYQCNSLKGNRTKKAWDAWMRANPRWWVPWPIKPPAIPYAESMYILKHGKKAYREAKASGNIPIPDDRTAGPLNSPLS